MSSDQLAVGAAVEPAPARHLLGKRKLLKGLFAFCCAVRTNFQSASTSLWLPIKWVGSSAIVRLDNGDRLAQEHRS